MKILLYTKDFYLQTRGLRPNTITPEQEILHNHKVQGKCGGTGTVPSSSPNPALPYQNRTSEGGIPLERCSNLIKHFESGKGNSFDKTSKFIVGMHFQYFIKKQDSFFIFF